MAKKPTPSKRTVKPGSTAPKKRVVKTTATSTSAAKAKATPVTRQEEEVKAELPFTRMNYILLIIGIAIILTGFMLMSSDTFVDATEFSVALHVAPWLVVGGFVEVIFAIMYRSKAKAEMTTSEDPATA